MSSETASLKVTILNQEPDPQNEAPSYYRVLVNGDQIKYITIEPRTFNSEDLTFPSDLIAKLPQFPPGDWNSGRIARTKEAKGIPYFVATTKEKLSSIEYLWHPKSFDYLSLEMREYLAPNVYTAKVPGLGPNIDTVIAKFARFPQQVKYYRQETRVYECIQSLGIGPEFLGYITEHGRVMGFLLEELKGRPATPSDLVACQEIVRRLHAIGILHGDLNKYNFLVGETGDIRLIDFETAKQSNDDAAMNEEIHSIENQLMDESRKGAPWRLAEQKMDDLDAGFDFVG